MTSVPVHGHGHGDGRGDGATSDAADALDRLRRPAVLASLAGAVLLLLGLLVHRGHGGSAFFQSYLFAYVFWTGLALGCFGLLMLQHLVGGAWGAVIQRPLEAGARLLPLMALLFLPLLLGMWTLYEWLDPAWREAHAGMSFKLWYLSAGGFVVRTVIYFVVWTVLVFVLNRWSAEQDRTGAAGPPGSGRVLGRTMQLFSGPGLVLYVVTVSLAAVDWVMSLTPDWYSTIFGLLFVVGQVLGTLAAMVALLSLLTRSRPLAGVLSIGHFHDLGNLMLAFVMLWAYVHFSQFLIIWSGNLAEETPYYYARTRTGWKYVALVLVIFHWLLPFVLLLWRRTKRNPGALAVVAVWVLVMRLVDLMWVIGPSFGGQGPHGHGSYAGAEAAAHGAVQATQAATQAVQSSHGAHPAGWWHVWMYPAAAAAIGGVWVLAFVWQLKRRPLLPLNDARLAADAGGAHHD